MVWPEENAEWSAGASAQVEDKCKWRLWSGGTRAKVSCEQMRRGEAGSQEGVQVKVSRRGVSIAFSVNVGDTVTWLPALT